MNKQIRIFFFCILVLLLVLVRAFQGVLFYDPLEQYFKQDYLYLSIPVFDKVKLFWSYALRYILNSIISMVIFKVAIIKIESLKTILIFYVLMFIVLLSVFFSVISFGLETGYLFVFYVRRFIIQPIFLIVILPFLYLSYQKQFRD